MTPTPLPPPDAAQTVAAAYQALLTAQAHAYAAYAAFRAAPCGADFAARAAAGRASTVRSNAEYALNAALDALLTPTPVQAAYAAYVAALVAEDATRQVYDDTPCMDDYEARVAWQCAIEAKFVAYAFWQAIEAVL